MFRASERKKIRRWFGSPAVMLVLIVLSAVMVPKVFAMYQRQQLLKEEEAKREHELNELTDRKQELERMLAQLEDAAGREAILRERFDVGREGEQLIVLVEKEVVATSTPQQELSWWHRLADFFKASTMGGSRD